MRAWKLAFDLRNPRTTLAAQAAVYAILAAMFAASAITAHFVEPKYVESNIYFFADFILPIFMMFAVLILFAEDFGRGSSDFVNSLPVSRTRFLLGRYLRIAIVMLLPLLAALLAFNLYASGATEKSLSYIDLLWVVAPTPLFLMSLALLSIVVARNLFYASIVCGGYALLDASFRGNFFDGKTLFISQYLRNFSREQIDANRTLYLLLSLAIMILAHIVFCAKPYKRYQLWSGIKS
jgi:ABC-type transport system involved in multi-copper enzyme maturation permease subunit